MLHKVYLFLMGLTVSVFAFAQSARVGRIGVHEALGYQRDTVQRDTVQRDTVKQDTIRRGISIRTNLFWDGAAEPNLGIEFPILKHFSLGLDAGFKSWPRWLFWDTDNINNPRHWRNFAIVPEFRFYPKRVYYGPFIGLDLVYTHFNVGNVTFPLGLYKDVRDHRVQGDFLGIGLFAGWSWWIGRHWRLEAQAGAAIGWAGYGRYPCNHCGEKISDENKLALVPKLGLDLAWNSAPREEEPDCELPVQLREVQPVPEVYPVANPGAFLPLLALVEPHRGAVDSVKTPFLQHISEFKPYEPTQVLRKKKGMIKAFFELDKTRLKTSFTERGYFRDNRPSLDSIVNITRMILADSISRVEKIQIVGFASIEGGEKHNDDLAKGRARALRDYVQQRTRTQESDFVEDNGGEGWAEFKDMLEDLLRETENGIETGFTREELQKAIGICGTPTGNATENRRKEQELRKDKATWAKIKERVLREQRNSGYVRVYVSWLPDTKAEEINEAITLVNSGKWEEGKARLETIADPRAVAALAILAAQLESWEQANGQYQNYLKARAASEEIRRKNLETEEWNAMAREHNIKVQECLNQQKKNKNKNK